VKKEKGAADETMKEEDADDLWAAVLGTYEDGSQATSAIQSQDTNAGSSSPVRSQDSGLQDEEVLESQGTEHYSQNISNGYDSSNGSDVTGPKRVFHKGMPLHLFDLSCDMLDEITSDVMEKKKKNEVKKDREGMHQRHCLNWIQKCGSI
jgi:hypothetical protein